MRVEVGRLLVAGRDAEALAREHGTPLYAFDVTRAAEAARALRDALARAGLTPRVRLALKAQRAPEVLAAVRALGKPGSPDAVGIDACSPGEVLYALEHGFTAAEISFTNESGVLLTEVVSVEERLGTTFVGLDAGWNVLNDAYVYGRPLLAIVPARTGAPRARLTTLAGHINEGDDVFTTAEPFPEVREGEIVAFPCIGGYCPGMWTDHCLRPRAATMYFADRSAPV